MHDIGTERLKSEIAFTITLYGFLTVLGKKF